VLRLEAQHLAHPGGVHAAAVGQERRLVGGEVAAHAAQHGRDRAECRRGHRHGRPAQPPGRLGEHHDPVPGDVEGAVHAGQRRVPDGSQQDVLVQQLQPRVEAEHGHDHRQPEVLRQRGADRGTDRTGGAQHGHRDVGPAPGEAADVALHLHGVLAEAGARGALGRHLLGEHRRVPAGGAVDRRGGADDQPLDARCLLTGGEQLHRADDVELLHRGAGAALGGRGHQAEVYDGVDVLALDDLGDHRVADVGAHEPDRAGVSARGYDVDADHPVDLWVVGEQARDPATGISRDPGHHDYAAHGVLPPPSGSPGPA
jgi:hypothetical protein